MRRGILMGLCLIAGLLATAKAPEGGKRVLLVHSYGSVAAVSRSVAFETELARRMGSEKVYVDQVYLDHARYPETDMEEALVDYLEKRVAKWQPDLVVPMVSPACVFVAQHRERLLPRTPVLYAGMDRRRLPPDALQNNAAFVGQGFNLPGFVEDILQLAPDTTNIVCVIGASPVEQYWAAEFQSEFARFTNRVGFTWLNDLPFDQMLERVKRLPPRSFVFMILMLRDAAGVAHDPEDVLKQIREAANAPVNSIFENQLGLGIVGGRLYSYQAEGVATARIAFRILRGEPASSFPPVIMEPIGPQYDWRELRRWGISEASLPPGSTVLFREPSFWKLYRWRIVIAVGVIASQSALIMGLLLQRLRRQKAELQAQRQQTELAHAARLATAGELSASIAHELNQPLCAMLQNASAAKLLLKNTSPDLEELRAIVADICADNQRATNVVRRLRQLLKRHALETQSLRISELMTDVVAIARPDAAGRRVQLEMDVSPELPPVRADRVHLQQVMLNLILNAMDALENGVPERRISIGARVNKDHFVEVSVSDTGHGISKDDAPHVFEPFFTTKAKGMGLGLSLSRRLIEAHGGRMWLENNASHGATFRFTLKPATREESQIVVTAS